MFQYLNGMLMKENKEVRNNMKKQEIFSASAGGIRR
jgi:hypothetical protein